MKKLTILHPQHGHKDVIGKDIDVEFRKIMEAGYEGKIPAVFIAEYPNNEVKRFSADKAEHLLDDPDVETVTVIGPLAGG